MGEIIINSVALHFTSERSSGVSNKEGKGAYCIHLI